MPIHEVGDRLTRLRALRARINAEIERIETDLLRRQNGHRRRRRPAPKPKPPRPPSDREIRAWARDQGIPVPATGRISDKLRNTYTHHHNTNTRKTG